MLRKFTVRLLAAFLGLGAMLPLTSQAQIMSDEAPYSFRHTELGTEINTENLPAVDVEALKAEDAKESLKSIPPRFGFPHKTKLEPGNSGTLEMLPNGGRIWRVRLVSRGALFLNLIFSKFHLPEGATLHVYSEDRSTVLGAFTADNNKPWNEFATLPVPGEVSIVEYYEPAGVVGQGQLRIGNVVHGYKDIFRLARGFGDSGSCNIDVACSISAGWQDEIKSVALIMVGGFRFCTGAMVNNVQQDGTPYFLTANHCLSGNVSNWTFVFNYDSPSCSGPDGSISQAVNGAVLRANYAPSDMALLELSVPPPPNYNVFYSGWNNQFQSSDTSVGIHHPNGDVKKICFDYNTTSNSSYGGGTANTHLRIGNWEQGTTEPGSSGSPLYDNNRRVIGQLHGGTASCTSISADEYGAFHHSWNTGSSASQRLRDWLDPGNTGATVINGSYFSSPDTTDASIALIESPSVSECDTQITPKVLLRNEGFDPLTAVDIVYQVDGGTPVTFSWTGNLNYYQSQSVSLPALSTTSGSHSFLVWSSSPNGQADDDTANDTLGISFAAQIGNVLVLDLTTDDYGSETTWEIRDANSNLIANGGGYQDNTTYQEEYCLTDGCYTFTIFDQYGDGICCTYGNGSYTISSGFGQIATGGQFGTSETTNFCFTNQPPTSGFAGVSGSVCEGTSVNFTDQSTNGPNSVSWTFQGGNPGSSTLQNPTIIYPNPGSFTVTQVVTNQNGSDTTTQTITVAPKPSVSVTLTNETSAGNDGTATANVSSGTAPYAYSWSTNPNQTTQTATGLNQGTYIVTVTDANGCTTQGVANVGFTVGIDQESLLTGMDLYPNPGRGTFYLRLDQSGTTQIQLSNMFGQELMTMQVDARSGAPIELRTGDLSTGVYLLKVIQNEKLAVRKLQVR